MIQADDLADLLRATAQGDRSAFREIYARVSSKLFGITLRICRVRELAEDALQEAFADIWRQAKDFDRQRGTAVTWMSMIARRRAIDTVRRATSGVHGAPAVSDEVLEMVPDPKLKGDGGIEYMALVACLGRLDDRQRDAVLRAYYRGDSRDELARHFEAPVNTVKTWLRRGLESLRGCLEE